MRWRVSAFNGYSLLDNARETVDTETSATCAIASNVTVTGALPLALQTFDYGI
jgi:hypothetical protein